MYRETIIIETSNRQEVIDITQQVNKIVEKSGIANGLCNIYVPHATAAVIINENADPEIANDLFTLLNKYIPQGVWRHDRIDNNGDAHLKSVILGCSKVIPVINNALGLGTWQGVMLVELDGPRRRKVIVTVY